MAATTIFSLPTELLEQIISSHIPFDQVFVYEAHEPNEATGCGNKGHYGASTSTDKSWPSSITPRYRCHNLEYSWPAPSPVLRSTHQQSPEYAVMSLLLTHSSIYALALRALYSANIFDFADPNIALTFAAQISRRARSLVQRVRVEVCGQKVRSFNPQVNGWRWVYEGEPDLTVLEVPKQFPNLVELILGGIGPGHNMFLSRLESGFKESNWWTKECITFLAKVVGVLPPVTTHNTNGSHHGQDQTSDDELVESHTEPPVALFDSWLKDANVVCQWFTSPMERVKGTRIIRNSTNPLLVMADTEKRVDVAAELKKTMEYEKQRKRIGRGVW